MDLGVAGHLLSCIPLVKLLRHGSSLRLSKELLQLSLSIIGHILIGSPIGNDSFEESCGDIGAISEFNDLRSPRLLGLEAFFALGDGEQTRIVHMLDNVDLFGDGFHACLGHVGLLEHILGRMAVAHICQQNLIILSPILLGLLVEEA